MRIVMLRKTKNITIIMLILSVSLTAFSSDDYKVFTDRILPQAVFRYTIIEIPSQGKIDWIEGDVELK